MRIAFLHYHLKPGGVATVIRRQVEALEGAAEVLVLTGEPAPAGFPASAVHIPALAYDRLRDPAWNPETIAAEVQRVVKRHWPGGCDLLHVHNPTLAKNRLLPAALEKLRREGTRLFLQVHDLAEDGRPEAYSPHPYPADSHWAVLNRRDRTLLHQAGLRKDGLHLLPNQVRPPAPPLRQTAPGGHVLYPVRAIRRKNLGEALLWSAFLPEGIFLAVTMGPNSPADLGPYRFWRRLAGKEGLPLIFEAARGTDFVRLVQEARSIITTSIAEGFGFAFLEPWAAGKLLWGRRIAVCDDFEANGVDLGHLYDDLRIPSDWIDRRRWRLAWVQAKARSRTAFGRPADPRAAEAAFESLAAGKTVDFGLLDETLQADVIIRCRRSPVDRNALAALNPVLNCPGRVADPEALIESNRGAVALHYGAATARRRLLEAYARARQPVVHRLDRQRLLDAFLKMEPFSLLRWGVWKD